MMDDMFARHDNNTIMFRIINNQLIKIYLRSIGFAAAVVAYQLLENHLE